MIFQLTEEQLAVQAAAREFAQKELKPGVIERDRHMTYPKEQVRMMGELGFLGMMSSPEYGGGGMDTLSYVLAMEEISKVDNSCSVIMSVNNSLVCWGLNTFGNHEQKEKYLTKLTTGEWIGAFCLSEPEAGSDATSQRTTAVDMGDHYLLNGTKNWITNGGTSKVHLVMAQTHPELGHRGINTLIVEADWDGVTIGGKEDKLGIRSSDTHSIMYTDVRVPKENRIGPDGFGFKFAMRTLEGGRIGIASQALGIAGGAYELALAYAKEREAFGKPIGQHQAIAFKLADMATEIEAAKLMVYRAAHLKDEGADFGTASAMAKLFASDVAMRHTVEAVQIHGGYGFVKEYHVERLMRDAKITQIYEGTSEVQRIVISRSILDGQLYLPVLGMAEKSMIKILKHIALLLGVAGLLYACGKEAPEIVLDERLNASVELAKDVSILYSDSAKLRVIAGGPVVLYHLDQRERKQEFIEGVTIDFFGPDEKPSSKLTAKYGIRLEGKGQIIVRDSVVWQSVAQERLETEELIWDEKTQRVFTNKFVVLRRPDEIIKGHGFEANQDFSDAKIKAVEGQIKVDELSKELE